MTEVVELEAGQRVLWHPSDYPDTHPAGAVVAVLGTQVSLRLDNGLTVLTWRWNVEPC